MKFKIVKRSRFTEFYSSMPEVLYPKLISYRLSSMPGVISQTLFVIVKHFVMTNIVTRTSNLLGMR